MASPVTVSVLLCLCGLALADELEYPKVQLLHSWNCKNSNNRGANGDPNVNRPDIAKVGNTWTEDVRTFPDNVKFAEIGPSKPGCYRFSTKVLVKKPVEKLWIRTLIKLGDLKSQPMPCSKTDAEIADPKSCEKGWGSCVWCNGCEKLSNLSASGELQHVACPVKPQTYTIEHDFCFPKAGEFTNVVPDKVKKLLELTQEKDYGKTVTKDVFIAVQMYDTDIYSACGNLPNQDDCPDFYTKNMKGCVISSARVQMKTIKELKLIAAPTRRPQGQQQQNTQ
jgi:hypothetical protein